MAKIVLGIATSHGPMLNTPPERWGARAAADRVANLHYSGRRYSFGELVAARGVTTFLAELGPDVWRDRHAACGRALGVLAMTFAETRPDVAVIISDDHMEVFSEANVPALLIFTGDSFDHLPFTQEQLVAMGPGLAEAEFENVPPEPCHRPAQRQLAEHLARALVADGFDIAVSQALPPGKYQNASIPHGWGFVYRRIMRDEVVPSIPIFLNAFYPPNQPTPARCYEFGLALRRAIESSELSASVALIASGGLSHFVIDEELDRHIISAIQSGDAATLQTLPTEQLQSGTAEIRNWIVIAGALAGADLAFDLLDYVPCYRSEAGTGNAMAFARWVTPLKPHGCERS